MKQLYIVRHSHALPAAAPEWRDFDRPLSQKGIDTLKALCQHFKEHAIFPDLIVTSPAKRTLATALILAKIMEYPERAVQTNPAIYQASADDLLAVIAAFDDTVKAALLVGHNPGVSELVNYFKISPAVTLSPASICGFSLEIPHWSDIFSAVATPNYVEIP